MQRHFFNSMLKKIGGLPPLPDYFPTYVAQVTATNKLAETSIVLATPSSWAWMQVGDLMIAIVANDWGAWSVVSFTAWRTLLYDVEHTLWTTRQLCYYKTFTWNSNFEINFTKPRKMWGWITWIHQWQIDVFWTAETTTQPNPPNINFTQTGKHLVFTAWSQFGGRQGAGKPAWYTLILSSATSISSDWVSYAVAIKDVNGSAENPWLWTFSWDDDSIASTIAIKPI